MRRIYRLLTSTLAAIAIFVPMVKAHCPLCTIGAGAVAGGAAFLGVSSSAIGVFIGAFAISMGLWIARMIKKRYVPYQKTLIALVSYVSTVLPLLPLLGEIKPWYIPWLGQYGTTIPVDTFFIGSLLGGSIVCISPLVSKKITELRNGKHVPYQGIMVTFGLLIIVGLITQFTI